MACQSTVLSSMSFLKRKPQYDTEKLYEIRRRDLKTTIPRTNSDLEEIDISIQDIRDMKYSIESHGFCCMDLHHSLDPEDFTSDNKILAEYMPQLTQSVKARLGADRVQVYDYIRRKRHPDFPARHGNINGISQPAYSVHIDETQADAKRIIEKINPTEHQTLLKGRWQLLIAWHPLRGPVRDWPLAVCDSKSVNVKDDLQPCDLINPEYVSEEYKVHFSPDHKWYYLRDQMPNEAFLMLQADSKGSPGVPHCAFQDPASCGMNYPLRESFDVRLLVFYDD